MRICPECESRELEKRQRICSECREINHAIAVDTWQSDNEEKIYKYQAGYRERNKDRYNAYMKNYMRDYRQKVRLNNT